MPVAMYSHTCISGWSQAFIKTRAVVNFYKDNGLAEEAS